MDEHKSRAKPLSPDERRAAILEAVTPLLIERGAAVTTAEMAEVAGIAEGTIFRVFPDKLALLHAAIARAMDPAPVREAMDRIDRSEPLREQLTVAIGVLAGFIINWLIGTLEWNFRTIQITIGYFMLAGFVASLDRVERERITKARNDKRRLAQWFWMMSQARGRGRGPTAQRRPPTSAPTRGARRHRAKT